jgi:hypothetical protein
LIPDDGRGEPRPHVVAMLRQDTIERSAQMAKEEKEKKSKKSNGKVDAELLRVAEAMAESFRVLGTDVANGFDDSSNRIDTLIAEIRGLRGDITAMAKAVTEGLRE